MNKYDEFFDDNPWKNIVDPTYPKGHRLFLNDDRFPFPTWRITHDLSMASYPKEPYVSFLDHILVSEQLLPSTAQFDVSTIMVEDYLGSYDIYEANISDHRPVMLRFNPLINQSASNEK